MSEIELALTAVLVGLTVLSLCTLRLAGQLEQRQVAHAARVRGAVAGLTAALARGEQRLGTRLDGHTALLDSLAGHEHPHDHPHDHQGAVQAHVHWLRQSSTEVTDGVRRDVYVCLVSDCKAIFAHTPG